MRVRSQWAGALASWLAAAATVVALPAQAVEGCGPVKLQGRQVQLARPLPTTLPADWSSTEAGRRCVTDLARELGRDRLLLSVTVVYRMLTDTRSSGTGLAAAHTLADALVATGLVHRPVSFVARPAQRSEEVGLAIYYAERTPKDLVARLGDFSGGVEVGSEPSGLRPAAPAMPLLSGELVRTSSEGQAVVQLIDGSGIRLARSTWIKLAPRWSDSGDRSVHVEVERGQIEAVVSKATQQSSFDVSNRVAVASVRGTVLRFANEPAAAARLETLEGAVRLSSASAAAAVEVAAGQGARVSASGTVGPARPLPAPPRVVSPLWGELLAPAVLTWAAGPDATTYLVELARDADFLRAATEYGATGSSLALPARPASGKWFWRVTACSAEGFFGAPSPVYSFTVRP